MSEKQLKDRGKALEDQFFKAENERLMQRLQAEREATATRDELRAASGIQSDAVLDRLVEAGIDASTLAALSLVPLVEVAWADGSMERRERQAILDAAVQSGIGQGGTAFELLEGWLETRPDASLLDTWKAYVQALCQGVTADTRFQLMDEVLGRARKVASAAGGFLGMGSKISEDEQKVLVELEKAFG